VLVTNLRGGQDFVRSGHLDSELLGVAGGRTEGGAMFSGKNQGRRKTCTPQKTNKIPEISNRESEFREKRSPSEERKAHIPKKKKPGDEMGESFFPYFSPGRSLIN